MSTLALMEEKMAKGEKEHALVLEKQRVLSITLKQEQDKLFRITTMLQTEKERANNMSERLKNIQMIREREEGGGGGERSKGDSEGWREGRREGRREGGKEGGTSLSTSKGNDGRGENGEENVGPILMAETSGGASSGASGGASRGASGGASRGASRGATRMQKKEAASFEGITKMNSARYTQAQNKFLEMRCMEAEKSRDAMTTKLVTIGTQLTKMQGIQAEHETLLQKHATLQKKQDILLEILGEKTEEVEGLNADIGEMKRMYRQQTETLLAQLAGSSSKGK
jgi:hypothetical protein